MAKPIEPFELPLNANQPLVMHIDMNSCFATMEQQANPLLRGRPICVSPYTSPRGITIAPSIEAKQLGIKLGMRNSEVKQICPDIVILPPNPALYRDAHQRFKKIFTSYTNRVAPKSIDEAVIDFAGSQIIKFRSMEEIGLEIKGRVKKEIGEWVKVSVGIGTNRFLAKLAAGLNKPNGLDVITHANLLEIYRSLDLVDLPGINVRYEARLNARGIFNPLQFFDASLQTLKKNVFKSIVGYYWYLRLRGWEIDDVEFKRKSIGHTYAIGKKTSDREELSRLLMKLCEKAGRRLRRSGYMARGIHLSLLYTRGEFWHKSRKTSSRLYTTTEIFTQAMRLLNESKLGLVATNISVSVFNLENYHPQQLSILDGTRGDIDSLARAIDETNDRYGEFVITPGLMLGMDNTIVDRIAFGGVKDLEDIYN